MKNILLIGGSTGIGYELSKKLVDNLKHFLCELGCTLMGRAQKAKKIGWYARYRRGC